MTAEPTITRVPGGVVWVGVHRHEYDRLECWQDAEHWVEFEFRAVDSTAVATWDRVSDHWLIECWLTGPDQLTAERIRGVAEVFEAAAILVDGLNSRPMPDRLDSVVRSDEPAARS